MNTEAPEIETYQERVRDLYQQVRSWLSDQPLQLREEKIELNEEAFGRYQIPCLLILGEADKTVATMKPIGASIIAADGRVDLVGMVGRQVIVYLTDGGATIQNQLIEAGRVSEHRSRPLFRGVEGDGWYWIEDSRLGRARRLDLELFQDLLREVSDYEY